MRRLIVGGEVEKLGFGIAVLGFSVVVNVVVSARLHAPARATGSPALEADAAHLRTDAATSLGVLVGLVLVEVTGAQWLDPVVALVVAVAIVVAGVRILTRSSRVLVDEALPDAELAAIRDGDRRVRRRGRRAASTSCARAGRARAGSIDMHVQFRAGTTLEEAHAIAHRLQDAIVERARPAPTC